VSQAQPKMYQTLQFIMELLKELETNMSTDQDKIVNSISTIHDKMSVGQKEVKIRSGLATPNSK
jgi:hypothetical protein